jgi:hypothetical protein
MSARRVKVEDAGGDEIKLAVVSDTTDIDELNAAERKIIGKGFTADRTMRKLANIPMDALETLCALGDRNALNYRESDYTDAGALLMLLSYHPEFRCSEGNV